MTEIRPPIVSILADVFPSISKLGDSPAKVLLAVVECEPLPARQSGDANASTTRLAPSIRP
jgi:hypothetical protein